MKGLFVKDLLILKTQRKIMIFLVLIGVISSITINSFGIGYLALLFCLLGVGTISYDEYDHGMVFLFTLPFTKKQYVLEKYLLCILSMLAGLIFGIVITLISGYATHNPMSAEEIYFSAMTIFALTGLFISVMIPTRIKFGNENGKIISGLILGFMFSLCLIISKALPDTLLDDVDSNPLLAGLILLAFGLLALAVSFPISYRIVCKKEL